ncbi:hypothetical protein M3I53_18585 [Paraburkholderia sp. CNPSo 3272]|uniref:hypothetical protein n=1 Tax=Paraburkholderia sp. CNPSo 3272 TaxID=2940931 RepID=UPI0020B75B3A|nr:hypothetical protein [Paraburkholderia sp. CNPSo 3272]MCP3725110.1 hypothetical protein [Paraburkholderia sp. CNPSo 3272]
MNTTSYPAAIAVVCASLACTLAHAQGTGTAPYGTNLSQQSAASGTQGSGQSGATAHKTPSQQRATRANGASAPRANAAEDTGAK